MLTLQTTVRAATAAEADDLPVAVIADRFQGGAYTFDVVQRFAASVKLHARQTRIRASIVAAQIAKETASFRFGGQVAPGQFNLAGIGATNDGAAGIVATSIEVGVAMVFAHHLNYLFGAFAAWPAELRAYQPYAVRNAAVLDNIREFGKVVAVIGDYTNGRWAWSPQYPKGTLLNGYAQGIVAIGNELLGKGGTVAPAPVIAISAGHHNSDGGDAFEIRQTGQLARAVGDACKALGLTVVYLTPQDGMGMDSVGLQAVARRVNSLRPLPAIYLETHTEGGGGTGVFAIYPDADGDVDADVKNRLGPLAAKKIAAATGLGLGAWGTGVMSERSTGVGGGGDRLGIFYATAPVKADVTRLIIEYGAHDKQPDLAIVQRPDFYAQAGRATAAAFAEFLGWKAPAASPIEVIADAAKTNPAPTVNPAAQTVVVPGIGAFTILEPILTYWRDCGGIDGSPAAPGYPLTGMYADGGALVQWFERARIEVRGATITSARVGAEALDAARAAGKLPIGVA